jgi:hypothetical protein
MFTYKYVLAAALLTAPPDSVKLADPGAVHQQLAPTLQRLAIDWQILDARENRYLLSQPQDFANDLKLLQSRYRELLNAPLVQDSARFPQRSFVNDLLAFNRAYRNDLITRLTIDTIHEDELRAALTETDQLYRIWDAVRDARCDYYYVMVRRQALAQLLELIGPHAYYSGTLPPHVPL